MKKNTNSLIIYTIIVVLLMILAFVFNNSLKSMTKKNYSYTQFQEHIANNMVLSVELIGNETTDGGKAVVKLKDNTSYEIDFLSKQSFQELMLENSQEHDFDVYVRPTSKTNNLIKDFIVPAIFFIICIVLLFFLFQQVQGGSGGSRVMNFGKSRAKMVVDEKRKVTFKSVAGLDEEKLELEEIVEFLKQPKKFIEIGARIPKGVLLYGPPGTGKTLLAKAVSGEAGVPFFSISGSDFVEMFVGVGASRVRDLFEQAKKNLPCIVFIDEMDAVGRRRGAGLGGGHDEREQTLNQLLVEMDGFGVNEGVIVIAATNRPDILDPALLRPGRFDRQIVVGRPDVKGREEILKIHAKNKVLGSDIDFKIIALTTPGFTGADLENLLNEAALLAARANKKEIDMVEIRKAFVRIGVGTEKTSRVITEKEKRLTAYHEAGHAIIHEVLLELDPVHIISIIPTGMAGGYTLPIPKEDRFSWSKKLMEEEIVSLLGGRSAEEIIFGDITTGASNDIKRATAIARDMVTKYGMSDILGPIQFGDDNDEVFIGRDLAHARNYGEEVASVIDNEIKRIISSAHSDSIRILNENIDVMHATAELLMKKEKITGEEFRELFPDGVINKDVVNPLAAEIPLLDNGNEQL